jgi:hypothetical protein
VGQPESRRVKRIRKAIEERGGCCFKIHGGDPFQEVGIPDLLVCFRGWFIGIEVKEPRGRLRPRQARVLRRIEEAGGIALVATEVDEVIDLLSKLGGKG